MKSRQFFAVLLLCPALVSSGARASIVENLGIGIDGETSTVLAFYSILIDSADDWEYGVGNVVLDDEGVIRDVGAPVNFNRTNNLQNPTQWGVLYELTHNPAVAGHEYCLLGYVEVTSVDPPGTYAHAIEEPCTSLPSPPSSPTSVNGQFRGCRWGFAKHDLYVSYVPNATWYQVYADLGSGYQYEYSSVYTTTTYVVNGEAYLKAKACNAAGCSGLSYDSYFSIWPCSLL